MGVSSPTGNGEKRGMEWAGKPGTSLGLRPARAKANQAASVGTHDMDSMMAADGRTDMKDDGKFTKITIPANVNPSPTRSHLGDPSMGSKVIMKGKMNR
jgi:hypothetical protein